MEKIPFLSNLQVKCLNHAKSTDAGGKPHLCGICLKEGNAYATNGHSLCKIEGIEYPVEFENKIILNNLKITSESTLSFEVISGLLFIVKTKEDGTITKELAQLFDAEFPDCERIIPTEIKEPTFNIVCINPKFLPPLRSVIITLGEDDQSTILIKSSYIKSLTWVLMPLRINK